MNQVRIIESRRVIEVLYLGDVVKEFPISQSLAAFKYALENFKNLDTCEIRESTILIFDGGIQDAVSCSSK